MPEYRESGTTFDAAAYLHQLDPDVAYSCKPLTGGVVNITVRASKHSSDFNKGRFPGWPSLVLKHAPPFIAGRADGAPMTQYRQTVEADALGLFSPSAEQSIQAITHASSVSVPAVLHHDTETHVLVLTDLGQLPNLSDIFGDLGGQTFGIPTPKFEPSLFSSNDQELSTDLESFFDAVGSRLGHFFAGLHTPETCSKILSQYPLAHFSIPEIRDVVLELAIKPVAEQIKLFPDLATSEEADFLGNILLEDFFRVTLANERSFILGDTWTGAVLVSPPSTSTSIDQPSSIVGAIDWEFATFGRGPHGDMAQFLAHFELLRISAQQHPTFSLHEQALDILIGALTTAYSTTAFNTESIPASNTESITSFNTESTKALNPEPTIWSSSTNPAQAWRIHHPPPDPSSLLARKLRSAFLTHGAEIINAAFWKSWTCLSPSCPRDADGVHTTVQHKCFLIRRMVKRGLWFLRHACRDIEAFSEAGNWEDIVAVDEGARVEGRRWLLDFFERR